MPPLCVHQLLSRFYLFLFVVRSCSCCCFQSELWGLHPEVKAGCDYADEPDGRFWMTFDDFTSIFTKVEVAMKSMPKLSKRNSMRRSSISQIPQVDELPTAPTPKPAPQPLQPAPIPLPAPPQPMAPDFVDKVKTPNSDVISNYIDMCELSRVECPSEFQQIRYLSLISKFSNIDGGYSFCQLDENNFGVWFDKEDGKYLYYFKKKQRYFVGDAIGSGSCYVKSEETTSKDPTKVKWPDLRVEVVNIEQNALNEYCENHHDDRFIDTSFLTMDIKLWPEVDSGSSSSSSGGEAQEPGTNNNTTNKAKKKEYIWLRAEALQDVGSSDCWKLFDKIEPADIKQGSLGDCWLLAAISAIAEFPQFIEDNVFVTKAYNAEGRYDLRLYDIQQKDFVIVTIDSLIPCRPKQWWEVTFKKYSFHFVTTY